MFINNFTRKTNNLITYIAQVDDDRREEENKTISNSYTMGCPPVCRDNPRALASGLSYVQVDKHSITILFHLH